jgi:hypothetical protein
VDDDGVDVVSVYGRSLTLLGDDWLSRRAERSFREVECALAEWHRFIGTLAPFPPACSDADRRDLGTMPPSTGR